jgi:hypothetical protein
MLFNSNAARTGERKSMSDKYEITISPRVDASSNKTMWKWRVDRVGCVVASDYSFTRRAARRCAKSWIKREIAITKHLRLPTTKETYP